MSVWCTARRGFTLLELLLTLVLLAVLFGIALPKGVALQRSLLADQAAQQLVGDFRRTQGEAVRRNRSLAVTRTSTTRYTIDSLGARLLPSGATFTTTSSTTIRFAPAGPPTGAPVTFTIVVGGSSRVVSVSATGLVSAR
jgi:prepilin-type N-terminal cleavage/methylation domain-containing protein